MDLGQGAGIRGYIRHGFVFAAFCGVYCAHCLVPLKILTKRIYYITNNLITKIPGIKKQGDIVLPQNKDTDEFERIESCLLEAIENIQGQYLRENRLEIEKKELINPHFLYNTLYSLKWRKGDNREHIDRLINYYRTSLNKGNLFLTVENEISIVRDYLDIQKFVYESDFRYSLKLEKMQ